MKKIVVSNDYNAIVDDCDYEFLSTFTWYIQKVDRILYAVSNWSDTHEYKRTTMHRIVANRMGLNSKPEIDHKDGNGLNNCRENIRECTRQQNLRNRRKTYSDTASKYKGVVRSRDKWKAAIYVDKIRYHLGVFESDKEAAKCYNEAALKHFGEFARLNIIED